MTLTLYEIHIYQDEKHKLEHLQFVLALLSLRHEGVRRVTKEILEARRAMLQRFCDWLGWPFGFMVFRFFESMPTEVGEGASLAWPRAAMGLQGLGF